MRLATKEDWTAIVDVVRSLPKERDGKKIIYKVKIDEIKPTRSLEQNSRYWALMTAISQQAPSYMGGEWHDPESWHEYCKRRFIGVESGPFGGSRAMSSKKLGVEKFSDYMTEAEAWAHDEFIGFNFEWKDAA